MMLQYGSVPGWKSAGLALLVLASVGRAQAAVPVEAVMPEVGQAHTTVNFTGSFVARRAAALSPSVSGLVAVIEVDAGDAVTSGDVLVRLDDRLAQIETDRAAAALEEGLAALMEAQRLRDEATNLGSRSALAATDVAAREAAVVVAEAVVSRANSDLAAARERLRRHTVVAPFNGVIASRAAESGEWVQTGDALLELVGIDELWLEVRAPQRYWPDVHPDTRVTAVADAFPRRTLEARVHARVPVSDPSARTFLVRLVVNDARGITPGMSARASFALGDGSEVLRVPRDAILRYPDGTTTVWVVDDSADALLAREVPVEIGRYAGDQVEVVGGIAPTDPIVVRGNEGLSEGQPVRLTHALPDISERPGAD